MRALALHVLAATLIAACGEDAPAGVDAPASMMITCQPSVGAGGPREFLDLRVHFETEVSVASRRIRVMTYDANDPMRVYATTDAVIDTTGSFDQTWTDAYRRFDYQPIAYYIDVDGDDSCTSGSDVGERHISTAWNPVDGAMLDERLAVFGLSPATDAVCEDIARCFP